MMIGSASTPSLPARAGLAVLLCASLTACYGPRPKAHGPRPMAVAATLTCPPRQGDLNRTAQASDGQSCDYAGPGGESVSLQRLALNGKDAATALGPTEAALRPLIAPHTPGTASAEDDGAPASGAAAADNDWDAGDRAKIDLPGVHIERPRRQGRGQRLRRPRQRRRPFQRQRQCRRRAATPRSTHAGPDGAVIRARDISGDNATLAFILASNRPSPSGPGGGQMHTGARPGDRPPWWWPPLRPGPGATTGAATTTLKALPGPQRSNSSACWPNRRILRIPDHVDFGLNNPNPKNVIVFLE